jgi:hypothetical protein
MRSRTNQVESEPDTCTYRPHKDNDSSEAHSIKQDGHGNKHVKDDVIESKGDMYIGNSGGTNRDDEDSSSVWSLS